MATQGGLRFGILRSMSSSRSPLVKPSEELKTVYLVRASGPRGPEGGGGGRPERSARKATIFCRSFRRETPELQAPSPSSQVRHAESMENAPRQEMLQSSSIAHNPTLSRAELSVRHFRALLAPHRQISRFVCMPWTGPSATCPHLGGGAGVVAMRALRFQNRSHLTIGVGSLLAQQPALAYLTDGSSWFCGIQELVVFHLCRMPNYVDSSACPDRREASYELGKRLLATMSLGLFDAFRCRWGRPIVLRENESMRTV